MNFSKSSAVSFLASLMISQVGWAKMAAPEAPPASPPPSAAEAAAKAAAEAEVAATYQDIKSLFGFVPQFLELFPHEGIVGAWEDMKAIQLSPTTQVSGKIKELIGLAVSAQIPCHYCVYFHSQAAKFNGAQSPQLTEAVAIAALVRKWSTVMGGMSTDMTAFRKQADAMLAYAKNRATMDPSTEKVIQVHDAESAKQDILQSFGLVPDFLQSYPSLALAGAWKELKSIMLSKTSLEIKDKFLIALGVSAQIPCDACTYLHRESAKLHGASETEIQESLAMAGETRHWSTFLNGMQISEDQFHKETDQIFAHLKERP